MANSFLEAVLDLFTMLFKIIYYILEAVVKFLLPRKLFMKDVSGQRVLITGAGSGIGRLMAQRFMALGCEVILWDINTEAVTSLEHELSQQGRCKAYTVDLASKEQIYKVADKVKQEIGTVDILINNAGIVTGRKYLDCPDNLIEKTMDINVNAHFWTVKSFLPAMLAQNKGHVVTIASGAGFSGVAGLCDYCASKFAAVGFDESLRYELQAMGKTGVHTTVVCPYYINTGMFEGVKTRFPLILPILEPDYAVDRIMGAILTNQSMLLMPRLLYFAYALKGLVPVSVGALIGSFLGLDKGMDSFVGRNKAQ